MEELNLGDLEQASGGRGYNHFSPDHQIEKGQRVYCVLNYKTGVVTSYSCDGGWDGQHSYTYLVRFDDGEEMYVRQGYLADPK